MNMRSNYSSLESQYASLKHQAQEDHDRADQYAVDRGRLQAERDHLHKLHSSLEVGHRLLEAETEQLRIQAAVREGGVLETEELRRQTKLQAVERGTLDAEVARLRAENSVLIAEGQDLLLQLQRTSSPSGVAAGSLAGTYSQRAFAAAEQWVLYHSIQPMDSRVNLIYMGKVTVDLREFTDCFIPVAITNYPHRERVVSAIENGSMARVALHAYRVHDKDRKGFLEWDNGDVYDFVAAVFQQHGLSPPAQTHVYLVYKKFDGDNKKRLEAEQCLCMTDALFRIVLLIEIQQQR